MIVLLFYTESFLQLNADFQKISAHV